MAVVDLDRERALMIVDGLREAGDFEIHVIGEESGLARRLASIDPDVVLVDVASPSRDSLEQIALASGPMDRPVAAARDWLATALDADDARLRLLAGRAGAEMADQGPIVCVCHGVGANRINAAIAAGAAAIDAVGAACQAGTNCGSCRPEIQEMLAARRMAVAAE